MKNQLCGRNYRRLYQIAFWKTFLTYFQIIWIFFIAQIKNSLLKKGYRNLKLANI